ncbi:hypothetical protein DFJ58DRAFT_729139 [Suillus subalutaceus]|uniref:uncharacterized protein n=1 Tax=Suillus subalutaceus TaxID=48586 RepID=UPI001B879592|nr:uncharacterized protein DFJ58DRAFT_729139 [Suillus subalutaceus]KAG1850847.1 hypothetical protein DFJ58DRAFT_729139 [Suillus subalutaceus]
MHISEKNAEGVIVNFATINLTAVAQPWQPTGVEGHCYGGWRITGAGVGLLVEVKRFAIRSLMGKELDSQIVLRIIEARDDQVEQAGYLFRQNPDMSSVMAIAAAGDLSIPYIYSKCHDPDIAGPYWSGTTIYRADISETMHSLAAKDLSYQPPKEQSHNKTLKWNNVLRVDLARSRERLYTVYKALREMRA